MPTPTPNAIDLTTVDNIINWLALAATTSAAEKQNIQDCITAFSLFWLSLTGNNVPGRLVPATSPFVTPCSYSEAYDGNGSDKLFLRHWPIRTVVSLTVNGVTVPQSTAFGQPGWLIDQSLACLVIRGGGSSGSSGYVTTNFFPAAGCGQYFAKGRQNVAISYTAGFDAVPFDVEMAVRQAVAVNYKRRQWIDQREQSMGNGAGTVSYRDWYLPPEVMRVVVSYQRVVMI